MERTEKKSPFDNTPKPLKRQGFSESCFQNGASFSSQARYDLFDTDAYSVATPCSPTAVSEPRLESVEKT